MTRTCLFTLLVTACLQFQWWTNSSEVYDYIKGSSTDAELTSLQSEQMSPEAEFSEPINEHKSFDPDLCLHPTLIGTGYHCIELAPSVAKFRYLQQESWGIWPVANPPPIV